MRNTSGNPVSVLVERLDWWPAGLPRQAAIRAELTATATATATDAAAAAASASDGATADVDDVAAATPGRSGRVARWERPGLAPGPLPAGVGVLASAVLAVAAVVVHAPLPAPLRGLLVGLGVFELIWQCDLRPRVVWNSYGAIVVRPFGGRATIAWHDVRCVLVCGGTVRIRTRDSGAITFGYGFSGVSRARLVRHRIRSARRGTGGDLRLPDLHPAARPWWAYGALIGLVLAGWLLISPA